MAPKLPWAKDAFADKGISAATVELHNGKWQESAADYLNDLDADGEVPEGKSLEELVAMEKGKDVHTELGQNPRSGHSKTIPA